MSNPELDDYVTPTVRGFSDLELKSLLTEYTCSKKCMGVKGNDGGCCRVDDRDFIMGPLADADDFILRLAIAKTVVDAREILIAFEEGSKLFPDRPVWQDPKNYPAMRPDCLRPGNPCVLYDARVGCTVYEIRPATCKNFTCEALATVAAAPWGVDRRPD